MQKAQVELDAFSTYQRGEKLFSEGKHSEALNEYQAAHSSSKVVDAKSTYNKGIIKVRVEINAKQLYEQGEELYSAGNYEAAKVKYKAAVNKSNVTTNKIAYTSGVTKAQVELDAIISKEQGDNLFSERRYADAKAKYKEAETKSNVAKEKDKYIVEVIKARTLEQFNQIKNSDNKSEWDDLRLTLGRLFDADPNNAPSSSTDQLQHIAERVVEIEEKIEGNIQHNSEILAHQTHLEHGGHGIELRDPQIALILETYTIKGMDVLLELRISSLEGAFHKQIKLFASKTANNSIDLHDVAKQLVQLSNENEITILPLLITLNDNNRDGNIVNHWVGLICERYLNSIIVSYLDSDSSNLEGLRETFIESLQDIDPKTRIIFKQIEVEQQRYNNCGPELIENIVEYLTGLRLSQEESLYVHSSLWEQSLILEDIKQIKDKSQNIITLSKITLNLDITDSIDDSNKLSINHSDTINLGSDMVTLSGVSYQDAESCNH